MSSICSALASFLMDLEIFVKILNILVFSEGPVAHGSLGSNWVVAFCSLLQLVLNFLILRRNIDVSLWLMLYYFRVYRIRRIGKRFLKFLSFILGSVLFLEQIYFGIKINRFMVLIYVWWCDGLVVVKDFLLGTW